MIERFCVAFTSRFCAAEFNIRIIYVSLFAIMLLLLAISVEVAVVGLLKMFCRVEGETRSDDEVL